MRIPTLVLCLVLSTPLGATGTFLGESDYRMKRAELAVELLAQYLFVPEMGIEVKIEKALSVADLVLYMNEQRAVPPEIELSVNQYAPTLGKEHYVKK